MFIRDLFEETYTSLTTNKVRTGLTMLGIIIGIGSVIAMVSVGQGAQASIESSIKSIGSNLLMVMPGAARGAGVQVSSGRGSAQTLTEGDADAITTLSSVQAVAPEVTRRYQVTARGNNTNTQVVGTTAAYALVRNVSVANGIFITEQHVRTLAKVAVLGPTTSNDLFGEGVDPIGQSVRINKVDFRVVGVTASKGGSGFSNQDDMIFVPLSTAQRFLSGDSYVTTISVQARSADEMKLVQEEMTVLLLERHKIEDPARADFNVLNQTDIVATASSVTGTFTLLLGAIAGISLLVGGIGIMNMMLTTVTERTREIGLRKAIGAKKKDITIQFLLEAVALTLVGGILGILFGWLIATLVSIFASLPTSISGGSVLLASSVSALIGIIFGYYPAHRAAKLNPIDALRYE